MKNSRYAVTAAAVLLGGVILIQGMQNRDLKQRIAHLEAGQAVRAPGGTARTARRADLPIPGPERENPAGGRERGKLPAENGGPLILPAGERAGFIGAPERIEHWRGGDKRRWGHEQATGRPDTPQAGDIPSAWASKEPDGGEEWLQLDYDRFAELEKVSVTESHNPGAIRKVVAVLSDGREELIWEGEMEVSQGDELVTSSFPVSGMVRARSVKLYLDTARVPGWNEIDAVQITGKDGKSQWATASSASSSYADP